MLVRDILSSKQIGKILSVETTDTVTKAAVLLSETRIGAVIVRDAGNELDGILSERDIVREIGKRGVECMEDKVSVLMTKEVKTFKQTNIPKPVRKMRTDGGFQLRRVRWEDTRPQPK